jgi:hypothetical protein
MPGAGRERCSGGVGAKLAPVAMDADMTVPLNRGSRGGACAKERRAIPARLKQIVA